MYSAVSSLKGIIKIGEVSIANAVFKLHTKLTVLILMIFSVVVSTNQFFGDPIDCFTSTSAEFPGNVLDNFCWIHSTYVLPSAMHKKVGTEVISPGIDKHVLNQEKTYISYYQWVCFFLFFAAVLFYIPQYIWKAWEGKKIEKVLLELNTPIFDDTSKKEGNINKLASYLYEHTLNKHTCYAYGFVICELLNFANVVGQIYFTNTFLGGEFTTYGTDVIKFTQMEQENRTDPMIEVFPRVTKCTFHKYGPSGSIQNHDALCVLPINILNEKIFIFLWFWYIILSIISGFAVLYRIVLIVSSTVRYNVLYFRCRYLGNRKANSLNDMMHRLNYGDWFVLSLLEENLSTMHFVDLMDEIYRQSKFPPEKKNLTNGDIALKTIRTCTGLDPEKKAMLPSY